MSVATFAGIVENGQIRLAEDVRFPEKTTVYVIVPGIQAAAQVASPRLVHPEQAADFVKKVIKEPRDAGV